MPFLHHSSWQVDDVDQIGHGAMRLLGTDPTCGVWGLGRHFLGSNYFWYLRDPAGNYAEYFADLDQIAADVEWQARTWDPDKALYAWLAGPARLPRTTRSRGALGGVRRADDQLLNARDPEATDDQDQ